MSEDSAQAHAPSGIASLPLLSWGSHIGQLFRSADDLRDFLVPYFQAGIENHERCLWVTEAPFSADDARAALRAVVPDLDAREQQGQIEILDVRSFYAKGAALSAEALIEGLLERERNALAAGYRGLRTNGNCSWVEKTQWGDFLDYESSVQQMVRGRRLICMCSYRHDGMDAAATRDVLDRHQFVLRSAASDLGDDARSATAVDGQASVNGHDSSDSHDSPDSQRDLDAIQAIAVLGHDLRNPLAAIGAGARLLRLGKLDERERAISETIGRSVRHMTALIDDISDASRSRFVDGIPLRLKRDGLEASLRHAIEELRLAHPLRRIDLTLSLERPVATDPVYMARMLSNLVKNALTYGAQNEPVKVTVNDVDGLVLSVSNQGPAIPRELHERLFAPFTRGHVREEQRGLGLGLYIVAEIARAHGGSVELNSDDAETRFTFRMPIGESES
ncbi:MEDS domain-containing protein [Paraburkholderia bannensis]|uniref:MEDS domain-containing protein n=1 Tax=Paraburkholderia bannensis TaxID=765414 RepID=UPI002ABD704A|nr:MEDS domain-containing protein [Paraburkholderia bannensis]